MATSIKRIEKEFVLCSARDDKTKLLLIAGSGEWPVFITSIEKETLTISHTMPLRLLKRSQTYEFRFAYREQPMAFRARAVEVRDTSLVLEMPETVHKNIERRYSRRSPPIALSVSFSFMGDRYDLAFPTTKEFEEVSAPEPNSAFNPKDIRALVREFDEHASAWASERAIRMFKDRKPESLEERLIVRTGKIYYLPTSLGGLPVVDPYDRSRIVTRSIFADFLREQGTHEELIDEEVLRFERNKRNTGVLSELMIPLLFQEYVIGYIILVNKQSGRPPIDLGALEKFLQFARILAYSLKMNGYFKNAPLKGQGYKADVLDISAGGLLFANVSRELAAALLPGSTIELTIKVGERSIKILAEMKRVYRDATRVYYGVEYGDFAPEDFRFLFEALYGRDFTDADAMGVEGLGIKLPIKFS